MIERTKAIIVLADNFFINLLGEISLPFIKDYAKKVDADFVMYGAESRPIDISNDYKQWSKTDRTKIIQWGIDVKCTEIKNLLRGKYERILYLDIDVLVNPIAPNIFDEVPLDCFAAWDHTINRWPATVTKKVVTRFYVPYAELDKKYGIVPARLNQWKEKNWPNYNNGIFLISRGLEGALEEPKEPIDTLGSTQDLMDYMLMRNNIKVFKLDSKWNQMAISHKKERLSKDLAKKSYFIHFSAMSGDHENRKRLMKEYKDYLCE